MRNYLSTSRYQTVDVVWCHKNDTLWRACECEPKKNDNSLASLLLLQNLRQEILAEASI